MQRARDEAEAEVHASRDRFAALAAEREVLLREVNHRVGNSLQIIASLLHLQASSTTQDDVKAALTNAMGRVAAVAQVHRRLYTSHDLKSVLLNQYLDALLEDLRRSAEGNRMSRLTLKAEPIEIDPDRAVAIGIIVNELVMNAVKYAYPDGAGPIHVELKAAGRRYSCCRSPTTASASTPRAIRARPAWASASSPPWPPSSTPASSATRSCRHPDRAALQARRRAGRQGERCCGKLAALTSRCANETIDDAGAFVYELLAAHPDIAARDFLLHPGKPDHVNAADADVGAEELFGDLRLHHLESLRQQGFLGLAELCRLMLSQALLFTLAW